MARDCVPAEWADLLDPEQQEVVLHGTGPLLVLAGAGSGKTRALTYRVAHLVGPREVPPERVLALPFSNRAARELRERLTALCGPRAGALVAGTFHAFGARLLRRLAGRVGRSPGFAIYDDDDQVRLVRRLLPGLGAGAVAPAEARRALEWAKRLGDPAAAPRPPGLPETALRELVAAYERELAAADAFDFTDLVERPAALLEEDPHLRLRERARWAHVLVDEFQDTDRAQARLLLALAGRSGDLVVVGDDDQSIYGWRGAEVDNILRFPEEYPGARVVRLERNYRSCGAILAAADAVIGHNRLRMGKRLVPVLETGEPVEAREWADGREEAARVAETIARQVAEGAAPGEFSVFYRINAQSRPFEDALRTRGLPYEVVGGTRFYDRAEVKDVLAFARLVHNRRDGVALLRILNVPPRGIGKRTVERVLAAAEDEGPWAGVCAVAAGRDRGARAVARFAGLVRGLLAAAEVLPPSELLRTVLLDTGYEARLRDRADAESLERLANLEELLVAAAEYERGQPEPTLAGFLELAALHSDVDAYRGGGRVALMTLHAAKGLEFDQVFLTGLEEGLFPLRRGDDMDVEEERRLCYVGMTRARRRLCLTWATRRLLLGELRTPSPSRFLRELPPEVLAARVEPERRARRPFRRRRQASPPDAELADPLPDYDCVDPLPDYDAPAQTLPAVGSRVSHEELGEGTVVGQFGFGPKARLAVAFPVRGVRRVLARYVTVVEE